MANTKYKNPGTWDHTGHDRVNGQSGITNRVNSSGLKEEAESGSGTWDF